MERKLLCLLLIYFTLVLVMGKPTDNNINNNIDIVISNPDSVQITIPTNPEEESPYIEGDILEDKIPSKSGYTNAQKHWTDGIVVYETCSGFTEEEKGKIELAMREIEENTCITFRERGDADQDYVYICNSKTGCSSYVGFQGGVQTLNLAPSCLRTSSNNPKGTGTACHELIHVIGYRHEHVRQDRDGHVTINWDNVKPGSEVNFNIIAGTDSYQVPYDYQSVMHYSSTAFAVDSSQPTIQANEGGAKIGQRTGPSELDYLKIRRMYNCDQVKNRRRSA